MKVPMRRILPILALALSLPLASHALENGVAVVTSAGAGIQSGTEVRRDLLGDCIVKLPTESQLAPVSTSTDRYLHKIDGTDKDGYATVWTSTIQIGWQVRQRFLYVVSTKGVGTTAAPQFREDTAQVFRSEDIVSDPSESSRFSETSPRVRYLASAQEAEASVRKRAAARLRELSANLCPDKSR